MTWTRERPKGVDAMRDYQVAHAPNGVRAREWYPSDQVLQTDDGDCMYRDSWWHPVRADGRYPALPVEDGRKWVPTKGHTLTGRGWNAYWGEGEDPYVDLWGDIEATWPDFAFDYVLPYRDGDTRDTLPPLPSDETPAPLTPAEEATLRGPVKVRVANLTPDEVEAMLEESNRNRWEQMSRSPAPEPSRLEIAARIMAGFAANNIDLTIDGDTPGAVPVEMRRWGDELAETAIIWTDALIAAARKGGAS